MSEGDNWVLMSLFSLLFQIPTKQSIAKVGSLRAPISSNVLLTSNKQSENIVITFRKQYRYTFFTVTENQLHLWTAVDAVTHNEHKMLTLNTQLNVLAVETTTGTRLSGPSTYKLLISNTMYKYVPYRKILCITFTLIVGNVFCSLVLRSPGKLPADRPSHLYRNLKPRDLGSSTISTYGSVWRGCALSSLMGSIGDAKAGVAIWLRRSISACNALKSIIDNVCNSVAAANINKHALMYHTM